MAEHCHHLLIKECLKSIETASLNISEANNFIHQKLDFTPQNYVFFFCLFFFEIKIPSSEDFFFTEFFTVTFSANTDTAMLLNLRSWHFKSAGRPSFRKEWLLCLFWVIFVCLWHSMIIVFLVSSTVQWYIFFVGQKGYLFI